MTDHMGRTLADAIKAAAKLKGELPHIVQVYPSDYDTIIMAAEIERLREALMDCWLKHDEPTTVDMITRAALAQETQP
jgi:hypothetical protein